MADAPMTGGMPPLYGRHSLGVHAAATCEEPPPPLRAAARAAVSAVRSSWVGRAWPPLEHALSKAVYGTVVAAFVVVGLARALRHRVQPLVRPVGVAAVAVAGFVRPRARATLVVVGGVASLMVGGLLGGVGDQITASLPGVHAISVVASHGGAPSGAAATGTGSGATPAGGAPHAGAAAPANPSASPSGSAANAGTALSAGRGGSGAPGPATSANAGTGHAAPPGAATTPTGVSAGASPGAAAAIPAPSGGAVTTSGSGGTGTGTATSGAASAPPATTPPATTPPATTPPATTPPATTPPVTTPPTTTPPSGGGLGGLLGGLFGGG